jgi:signal transduction histidine kinase
MNPGHAPMHGASAAPLPVSPSAEVMRTVTHELRQPLSSIESIAYYLTLVLPKGDDRAHEQLHRIQELIEQSHWILTIGVRLAACRESCEREPSDVAVDLEEAITLALSAHSSRPTRSVNLELAGGLPPVRLDPDQAKGLVESLLMLFRQIATEAYPVTIRTSAAGRRVVLEIFSTVPGYRSESALGPGAPLGIELARRIAEAQGGSFDFKVTRESVFARVTLV